MTDLQFLRQHAHDYAATFPRNDNEKCDAYADWYAETYGDSFIPGGSTPDHSSVYHSWSDDYKDIL